VINIEKFYKYSCSHKCDRVEVDLVHNCLIFGAVLSSKPTNALELGIGKGYATRAILYALKYNQIGRLTSVDDWHDWKGEEPSHIDDLRNLGVNVIAPIDEGDFVRSQPDNSYDFLMSDGSHRHAGEWAEDVFRIMKYDSIMFFHDVKCPSPRRYIELSKEKNLPHFIFSKSSLANESCERGLLMVINK
jgi:predicted O-methyltransferase YrrM